VNKEVESYNLQADTFSARRVICDHVNAVGGIFDVDVANKQLQVPGKSIRHIWKIKGNRRQSRLDGRGNLSVLKKTETVYLK